jgi:hypothetical protein
LLASKKMGSEGPVALPANRGGSPTKRMRAWSAITRAAEKLIYDLSVLKSTAFFAGAANRIEFTRVRRMCRHCGQHLANAHPQLIDVCDALGTQARAQLACEA